MPSFPHFTLYLLWPSRLQPCLLLTHVDPAVLHSGGDGPEQPSPQAHALAIEVPHDLVAFAVDARGAQGTCYQGQPPMDLVAKGMKTLLGPGTVTGGQRGPWPGHHGTPHLCVSFPQSHLPPIGLQDQSFCQGLATWIGVLVDGLIWGVLIAPAGGVGRREETQHRAELGAREGPSGPLLTCRRGGL